MGRVVRLRRLGGGGAARLRRCGVRRAVAPDALPKIAYVSGREKLGAYVGAGAAQVEITVQVERHARENRHLLRSESKQT
eukprot:2435298-Pleurochrysis_carterae.AAC.1